MTDRSAGAAAPFRRVDLLAPAWWPWHILAIALVGGFIALGIWQLDRHEQRSALVIVLEARRSAEPVRFEEVVSTLDEAAPLGSGADAHEVGVLATGTFMYEASVTWRNRSFEGVPGHHVVTPLRLESDPGRAILVDRGWVSYEAVDRVDADAPVGSLVSVLGVLVPEADDPVGPLAALAPRDPTEGPFTSLARIDADRLQAQLEVTLERFVLVAAAVTGEASDASGVGGGLATDRSVRPLPVPREDLGPGPHLSYALQWFGFAVVVAVGYASLLRSRVRILSGIERDPRTPPRSPSAT